MSAVEYLGRGSTYFGRDLKWLTVLDTKVTPRSVTVTSSNVFGEEVVERYKRWSEVELNQSRG